MGDLGECPPPSRTRGQQALVKRESGVNAAGVGYVAGPLGSAWFFDLTASVSPSVRWGLWWGSGRMHGGCPAEARRTVEPSRRHSPWDSETWELTHCRAQGGPPR